MSAIQHPISMRLSSRFAYYGSLVATAVLPVLCVAQTPAPPPAEAPQPPALRSNPSDDRLEPVITIRKEGEREIEEYRIRGQLFAMRVKVKGAPAYWLVDPDGSGRMVPGQGIGPTIAVPKWVLKEF